ncbi:MAG TPA: hypothetical protein VKV73_15870 [Chloroflexota bacterium]|nr:hypothetical protein [Chloroflexota bacterium]
MSRFTVLLVDDAPTVLAAVGRLLRKDDIKVLSAEGGELGLAILEASADTIDAVVSDYECQPGVVFPGFRQQRAQRCG